MKHLLIIVLLLSAIFSANAQHSKDSSFEQLTNHAYVDKFLSFAETHHWNMTVQYDSSLNTIMVSLTHGAHGDPDNVLIVRIDTVVRCQLQSLKKPYTATVRNELSHAGILFWIDDMQKVSGTDTRVYQTTWHEFHIPKTL